MPALRRNLLKSIASIIADYRVGEVDEPTPDHVDQWIRQFPYDVQEGILAEMDHVLKKTYYSRERVREFLAAMMVAEELVGKNPKAFWRAANILHLQKDGSSQADMIELFDELLTERFGLSVDDCASPRGPYIFLDDAIYGGLTVQNGVRAWLEATMPKDPAIHVVTIALHRYGRFSAERALKPLVQARGGSITFWPLDELEDRHYKIDHSDVLRPTRIPDDPLTQNYFHEQVEGQRYPYTFRRPGGRSAIFSGEAGRDLIEQQFLTAGVKLISLCGNPKKSMRPLGFSGLGFGFGALLATYRNCANNCPLVLWWGDPAKDYPLDQWYPLLPRRPKGE